MLIYIVEAEMLKRRVALLCDQNLLGESLEHILVNSEEDRGEANAN